MPNFVTEKQNEKDLDPHQLKFNHVHRQYVHGCLPISALPNDKRAKITP